MSKLIILALLVLTLIADVAIGFSKISSQRVLRSHDRRSLLRMTKESFDKEEVVSVDKAALKKMRENIADGEFGKAFLILKRNPMMNIEMEDARVLLNNVNELID